MEELTLSLFYTLGLGAAGLLIFRRALSAAGVDYCPPRAVRSAKTIDKTMNLECRLPRPAK
jgi:hypothetical protein